MTHRKKDEGRRPLLAREPEYSQLVGGESAYSSRGAYGGQADAQTITEQDIEQDVSHGLSGGGTIDEEGLSVSPEELGRVYLQDATEARSVAAVDVSDVADDELDTVELCASDHEHRSATLPTHESDVDGRLYPAFESPQLRDIIRHNEGLYMRWTTASARGEIKSVVVNGHRFAVVKNRDLATRIGEAAPELEGYLFDMEGQRIITDSSFA